MSFIAISDVHIKKNGDESCLLMEKFFNKAINEKIDEIFLLGDIFDLIVGNHIEYTSMYSNFFDNLKKALEAGVHIHFFEGNHDFMVEGVFASFISSHKLEGFTYVKAYKTIQIDGKKIYFTHGDLVEIDNFGYRVYKFFINNFAMNYICSKIMSHQFVKRIGDNASNKSREANSKYLEPSYIQQVKNKFRRSADVFRLKNVDVDVLVCGHSHIKDRYDKDGLLYLNNGYAPKTETCILYKEREFSFVSL